jgi:UPF0176 protein
MRLRPAHTKTRPMTVQVSAFYKFVALNDTAALRAHLFARLQALEARGTILLAPEGINGTISAALPAIAQFLSDLRADSRFADLLTKDATAPAHPFKRLKVKLKREIISFRQPGADPTVRAGTYVKPQDWNALIRDPAVFVLDTRNAYEVEAGTFRGAVDPKTRNFGDLADYIAANLDPAKHTKVAMFCTGGIRCEKASAYMLSQGFPEVFHLEGGILNYFAKVPEAESMFDGACFVFDEREAVDGR